MSAKRRDPRLEMQAVRARYNDPHRYELIDVWHRFTAIAIYNEVSSSWPSLRTQAGHVILNAGAGGNDLGVCPSTTINLDISEARLLSLPQPVQASVEALPFVNASIDTIVCVGSVINYCDAALVIGEFSRILKPKGCLALEFESSHSAELITQRAFGRSAAVAETFYAGQPETIWVYTFSHIRNLLDAAGLTLKRSIPIHVLSPWAFLLLRSLRAAAIIARLDRVARNVYPLTRWSSNHLLFCEKDI